MLKPLALTLAGAAFAVWPTSGIAPRFAWNATASAPIGLYWIGSPCPCPVGTMVLVPVPPATARALGNRDFLPTNAPLLKHVAAGPGQRVCRRGTLIMIDGVPRAHARGRDRSGVPLPKWSGCTGLGTQQLFLLNDVPSSFDSRYFGPVPTVSVIGQTHPIWTWETRR